jgi:hypothetical protein
MKVSLGLAAACFGVLFIISACSAPSNRLALPDGAHEVDGAERLVETLKGLNAGLQTYKGIGKLALDTPAGPQKTRIAWVGAAPGKLRVEVLAQPGGQPFFSIASDGQWFYAIAHPNDRFIKKKATRSSLKRLIAIPVGPRDVFTLLTGRVPILPYATARLYAYPPADGSVTTEACTAPRLILTLTPANGRYLSQKIHLVGERVQQIEYFDRSGNFLYRTILKDVQAVNGYLIPKQLFFSDDNQASARIEVERCWTNVAVAPSVFQLKPPETKE